MAEETPQEQPNGSGPEVDYEAKYREAIAHSREWEKRAKANSAAAQELQQLKEAQLSESEKAAKHVKELEEQVAAYQAEKEQHAWKADVSKATGIPAVVLRGATLEEIQAHAEAIKEAFHLGEDDKKPSYSMSNPAKTPSRAPLNDMAVFAKTIFSSNSK